MNPLCTIIKNYVKICDSFPQFLCECTCVNCNEYCFFYHDFPTAIYFFLPHIYIRPVNIVFGPLQKKSDETDWDDSSLLADCVDTIHCEIMDRFSQC